MIPAYRLALLSPFWLFLELRAWVARVKAARRARPRLIPTFAATGKRIRDYSPSAIARLLALDLIVVERYRRGAIKRAHFRPQGGANPVKAHAHMGTHYSYEQPLPSGRYAWTHKPLLQEQEIEALFGEIDSSTEPADRFVRAVFRAVPLSVMRPQPPSCAGPARRAA